MTENRNTSKPGLHRLVFATALVMALVFLALAWRGEGRGTDSQTPFPAVENPNRGAPND